MDLNALQVFAKVVEAGSFVGAARELELPKSTVSRRVAALEAQLGARLLQRTTRKLSLTDAGRAYYEHAARALAEVGAAERAVTQLSDVPRGRLRITTPLNFGFLGGVIADFALRYAEVEVEIVGTDRVVDLIEEGFDLAIRAGKLRDGSLVGRRIGALERYLVASPELVKRRGRPKQPEELRDYPCLIFGGGSDGATWRLVRRGQTRTVRVTGRLVVNDFELLDEAARHGLGVALLPIYRCADDLRAGTLVRVLPDWCSPEQPLTVVYPSARHLAPKVRAFVDHLTERMTPPPWASTPGPDRSVR
ncbi:MAG: LysR family transcriptional regulator [Sandaracinaceae bacterium]|nr:LysR family transcriptional regulator [Sandaracinaceae bacterium]